MPTNRRDIPRADRVDAILDVATRLFLERGYQETTVGDVAVQAGVRTGTVHWYFASKDDLLAAVMVRAVGREYERAIDASELTPRDQLVRFLSGLRPFRELKSSIRERARASDAVHQAQRETGEKTRELVARVLDDSESWCDPEIATELLLAAFEGNNLMRHPQMYGTELIGFLLDQVFLVSEPWERQKAAGRSAP